MDKIFGPFFTEQELGLDKLGVNLRMRESMFHLVTFGLNKIREKFGPITITSGVRSLQEQMLLQSRGYNPSPTSQHLFGEAVDFVCKGQNMEQVFFWIRDELKWQGQCFLYAKKGHIHIALPTLELKFKGRLYCRILDQ